MPAVARGVSRRTELLYREYRAAQAALPGVTEQEIFRMLRRVRPDLTLDKLRLAMKRTQKLVDAGKLPADEEPVELDDEEAMAA